MYMSECACDSTDLGWHAGRAQLNSQVRREMHSYLVLLHVAHGFGAT